MLAWIAAVLFLIAAIVSGGLVHASSPWLSPVTLIAAGLVAAMLHAAGAGPVWPRRRPPQE